MSPACPKFVIVMFTLICSFRSGFLFIYPTIPPVRGSGRSLYVFHAFCWSGVFHHCVPCAVSYPYRAQALGHHCRNSCLVCWSWERYCRMDAFGFECRFSECGVWTHSLVYPLDLHRVDFVPTLCGEEGGVLGRHSDWFNHQRAFKEFHDLRYPSDVWICVLYRCYRCTCDLRFVSVFLPDRAITRASIGAFVTGLIVPREGNLAITMTEKLEDVVEIIFLPLVRTFQSLSSAAMPTYLTVLHHFWSFDKPWPTQLRYYLGLHYCHMRHLLHW